MNAQIKDNIYINNIMINKKKVTIKIYNYESILKSTQI